MSRAPAATRSQFSQFIFFLSKAESHGWLREISTLFEPEAAKLQFAHQRGVCGVYMHISLNYIISFKKKAARREINRSESEEEVAAQAK